MIWHRARKRRYVAWKEKYISKWQRSVVYFCEFLFVLLRFCVFAHSTQRASRRCRYRSIRFTFKWYRYLRATESDVFINIYAARFSHYFIRRAMFCHIVFVFAVDILAHIRDACRRPKRRTNIRIRISLYFFHLLLASRVDFVRFLRWSSVVSVAQRIHKFGFVNVGKLLQCRAHTYTYMEHASFAFQLRGTVRTTDTNTLRTLVQRSQINSNTKKFSLQSMGDELTDSGSSTSRIVYYVVLRLTAATLPDGIANNRLAPTHQPDPEYTNLPTSHYVNTLTECTMWMTNRFVRRMRHFFSSAFFSTSSSCVCSYYLLNGYKNIIIHTFLVSDTRTTLIEEKIKIKTGDMRLVLTSYGHVMLSAQKKN